MLATALLGPPFSASAAGEDLTLRQELLLQSFSGSALRWEKPSNIRIGYLIDADTVDLSIAAALDGYFSGTLGGLSDVIGRRLSASRDDADADILIIVVGAPGLSRFRDAIERVLLGRVDLGTGFARERWECLAYARAQDDRFGTHFVPNIGVAARSDEPLRDSPMQRTGGVLMASALKGSDTLESCISSALPRLLGLSGGEIKPSMRLAYGGAASSTTIDALDLALLRGLYRTETLHSGDSKFRAMALYKQYLRQSAPAP
jgi:hypothetical protein